MNLRKLILLPLAALLLAAPLYAQERKLQNKPFIDERRFHYGFFIGLHDQGLKLRGNGFIDEATGQQWMAENDAQNFGFSVGILGDWRLTRDISLRVAPSMHFGSKHLKFLELGTGDTKTQDMKTCYIGVPVDLKVAAPRFNNYRPYVLLGVQPMYDLTQKKGTPLRTAPLTTCLEVGLGCDMYLPFFKLIPELKFCIGLADILTKKRDDLTDSSMMVYTNSVQSATANMVVLSFYFE